MVTAPVACRIWLSTITSPSQAPSR